jgi:hypothetical protein
MRGSAAVLALVPLLAAAAPAPFAVTRTQQSHRGGIGVAAGPAGWAIAWEEIAPTGADERPRTIHAAIVGDGGTITTVATPLWSARTGPSEELVAWNGSSFTVVVCSDAWNQGEHIVWGELTPAGAFTPRGDLSWDKGALYCAEARAVGDHVEVIVASDNTAYGAYDQILSRTCAVYRVALRGDHGTIAKAAPLCTSEAAGDTWIAGEDAKNRFAVADAKGKAAAPRLAIAPHGVFAFAAGPVVVVPEKDFKSSDLVPIDPKTKKPGTPVRIDPIAGNDPGANANGFTLPGDRVALVSYGNPQGLAIVDARGKVLANPTWAGSSPAACAARGGALLCTWYADDHDTTAGEVYAIVVPLP